MQVVYAIGILCICARSSEPWLHIDVITADISSTAPFILQIIQKKSASSMFAIESNGVVYAHQRETSVSSNDSLQIRPFSK